MRFPLADPTAIAPLVGTALIVAALYAGARRAAVELALPAAPRRRLLLGTALVLGAWVTVATAAALGGTFGDGGRATIPPVAFGLLLPMLVVLGALALSPTARRALAATPQRLLIGVQLYRMLGGVFLVLLAQGRMPGAFALPAGWGDVAVGAAAPLLAWGYQAGSRRWHRAAVAWNVLGILDLVVAVGTGVLTAPGHLQRLALDAPNTLITRFPYVLIPTVLVPVSLLLHAVSLHRLAVVSARPRTGDGPRARTAAAGGIHARA